MELRHFRCFVAVAEELHFGKAARRLNLSQPPVSLAIKELETEIGLQLFERTSRRIVLTPQGQEVLHDARAILARTELLKQHAAMAALGAGGSLSLGFISLDSYSFLPSLLLAFTGKYPGIRLTLQESTTDRILAELEAGSIDVGSCLATPSLPPTLIYRPTNRYALVLALPENHRLAKLAKVPLDELAEERFMLFERHIGPVMFDTVVSVCMRHGFSPRLFHARQQHTIVSMVAGGVGVALVPSCVQVMRREGVVYRPIRGETTYVESGVAWRRDDESFMVREFLEHVPKLRASASIGKPDRSS
jgi:DNA-binding transcriptional LysR family regulator